jgi:hypothetical protein
LDQGVPVDQVVRRMEASDEYRFKVVNDVYVKLQHRTADPSGLNSFVAFLANGGTMEQAEISIVTSAEYFQRAGGANASYLASLYHDILGRTIDPTGQVNWGATLTLGPTIANFGNPRLIVARGVIQSLEAAQDRVEEFYQRFHHRAADPSGLQTFVTAQQHGLSDEDVIAAIVGSQEYALRVQQVVVGQPPPNPQPPTLVIQSPSGPLAANHNITITGQVTDNLSVVASLQAQIDSGPLFGVAFGAAGNFNFSTNLALDGSADGSHIIHVQATDQAGNVSSANISFTLDTVAPTLSLIAPLAGANLSGMGRLIGTVADATTGVASGTVALDGGASVPLLLDSGGHFDQPLASNSLSTGAHQVMVQTVDQVGNSAQQTVSFMVTSDFLVGPTGSQGWGQATSNTIRLEERTSFLVQDAVPVQLGPVQGSRTLSFQITPQFDTTDQTSATKDRLLVYLVDPTHPNQTLLDGGQPGTPVFMLSEGGATEFPAGLVRFNGSVVQIDATSLTTATSGLLVFQLLNGDSDTGTVVQVQNITDTVDPQGMASPLFATHNTAPVAAGPALDLTTLSPTSNVQLLVRNVHFDPASGQYSANLQVQNNGPAFGRTVAVVFPGLPAGVQLQNPSGTDASGAPYLNFHNAIPAGGLGTGDISDPVQVLFNDPGLLRFTLTPAVLTAGPNQPPNLDPIGPLSVMPGQRLVVPLHATDPDGDPITFSIQNAGTLPTGMLQADGSLLFTPTPGDVGTYNFTVAASDGALQATQPVTLTVAADPDTSTRLSGTLLSTGGQPLAAVPVELGTLQTVTGSDGSFLLKLPPLATPTDSFNIPVPTGDPQFDPAGTGTQFISFQRARFAPTTGTDVSNPRRYPNLITAFIDASFVYGSDPARAAALRTNDGTGHLKTSPGNLLPFNDPTYFPGGPLPNDNSGIHDPTTLFVAGDNRANENIGLASLHTLFVREHNRLADQIRAANPSLSDEEIYQRARRLVGAEVQFITYNEFLPLLLGPGALSPYAGYNPNVDPGVGQFFTTAAFRYAHSHSFPAFPLLDNQGNPLPGGPVTLSEGSFNSQPIVTNGIDPILRGLVSQPAQGVGLPTIDAVRNLLFGPPGSGGIDLVATDIQRGRDLGLPSYNQTRQDFGLAAVTSFSQISSDPAVQAKLQAAYGSVDKVDAIIGGLAEDKVPGALVGPLFYHSIKDQFERLRDGDRFWYENGQFTQAELNKIRASTLAQVIMQNTGITGLPADVFTSGVAPAGPAPAGTVASGPVTDYRSITGTVNNTLHPNFGAAGSFLRLDSTVSFGDGISTPAGSDRPGARQISNQVAAETGFNPDPTGFTALGVMWSQLLTHDISFTPTGTPNTLKIHGDALTGSVQYPFIAEKVKLLLGHEVYDGVNNVITRPIFLPSLDVAHGQAINPSQDQTVTTATIPGASVFVAAGTLQDRAGNPFTGTLSITEVPAALTPASLPANLKPDLVVTIQPGEMVFKSPAPLTLPNLSGYAPGKQMQLWSINPVTGVFDHVGTGQVSADGSVIQTISGGIHNSSWHFFVPAPETFNDPNVDPLNQDNSNVPNDQASASGEDPNSGPGGGGTSNGASCDPGSQSSADAAGVAAGAIAGTEAGSGSFNSDVELHSGAVLENHQLVTYQSLGVARGLTLHYDSLRADPRPIVHFGFPNVDPQALADGFADKLRVVAKLSVQRGNFQYQLPGFMGNIPGLSGAVLSVTLSQHI